MDESDPKLIAMNHIKETAIRAGNLTCQLLSFSRK